MRALFITCYFFLLAACTSVPEGIRPTSKLSLDAYLGQWFEIARLDHSFERDLINVTAYYERNADGSIKVVNRGLHAIKNEENEAIGRAKLMYPLVDGKTTGHFKVSFFGPFYASYVIFELGPRNEQGLYSYAYVTGPDRDYAWLLARSPNVPKARLTHFIETLKTLGFDTKSLITQVQTQ